MKTFEYKDSEIGKIPADWDVASLSEIASDFSYGVGAEAVPFNGTDKYIRITDIDDTSHQFNYESIVSPAFYEEKHIVKKGDILIARTGASVGKSYVYSEGDGRLIFAGFLMKMNIFGANPNYIGYQLFTNRYWNWVASESARTGQPGLNLEQIKQYLVALPPLEEQNAIAEMLSSTDSLISSLDKAIEKKRLIKEGLMQELLTGKKRLKGFSGEWIEKTIGELGELTGAGVDKLSLPTEKPVRLVNYVDVFRRDFLYNREQNFWVTASDKKIEKCNVLKGDVFFTPSSEMPYDIALSAVAMEDMPGVCYSYHIYRLRFNEEIDLDYKAYLFKSSSFYKQASTLCEGSGKRYVISMPKFRSMTVRYPKDIEEQRAIAKVLSNLDKKIKLLDLIGKKTISIKQGMMQELLTGKTRLI